MQILTFTPKMRRQRRFLSFLLPLFALFMGVGSTKSVLAQAAITAGNITLNVRGTSGVYDTHSAATGPGVFNGNNFGTFNLANPSNVFVLNGESLTINDPNNTYNDGQFLYRVYQTGGASGTFTTIFLGAGTFDPTNKVRTFANASNVNLLAGLTGSTGTNYTFDLIFKAVDNNNFGPNLVDTPVKSATFTVITASPSTATLRNVVVTSGTTAANATTNTYDATSTTPGPGVFNSTNFGTLDAGAGQLLLQGGSIQIAEKNGDVFDQASITYVVSPGTLSSPATGFGSGQTLALVQTGYNAATMTRTFSLSNAARNILAMATTGGTPGTSYRFDVAVQASGSNSVGQPISILGIRQPSVFTVTGTPTFMPTLTGTTVFIAPSGGPTVTYDANNVSANPKFDGANLGTFDVVNGQLVLNGGGATTTENGPNQVSDVTLYFRVRQSGTGGGGYTPLTLTQTTITTNADGSRTRTFTLNDAARNLLSSVTAVGGYNVDAYLVASGANKNTGTNFVINDRSNAAPYTANFTVTGTPIITTVWTGGKDDNWFDVANWNNGVPTANKNALIPNFPSGNTSPYPNIYSDAIKAPTAQSTSTNPDGTVDIIPASPGYNNTGSGNAMVRNLTLQANTQLDRSILRLIQGRLDVFGDFDNPQGSFIQRAKTVISFKALGNQSISGSINGFVNVEIDGGVNSIKTLINNFTVKSGGSLKFINGILQTNIALVSSNFVGFEGLTTDPATAVIIPAAQLLGETETSWLRGFITTTQQAPPGVPQTFSNIGLALTFTGNDPGNTTVTRNTGDNYPQTSFAGSTQNPNANPKPSIRRVFGVQPGNPATQNRLLIADLSFRYLSNELMNVRTFNGGTATTNLDQNKLSLYVSVTGGNTFNQLGRDSNVGNVLTKRSVTTFATFTLSEAAVLPLPVTLKNFDAKRIGDNALVTWQTASEENSKGYEVQVSTNGTQYRTLAFIPSAALNTMQATAYSYVDKEANKMGKRYYRLHQIDIDGKSALFAPVAVSFENDAKASDFAAYPNPLNAGNELHITLQSAAEGTAKLLVSDMTGRTLQQQNIVLTGGLTDASVAGISDLKAGVYLVRITLPTGETKNLKVVKQ